MQLLSKIGLENGLIYETIVSTLSLDGTFNAAPMGLRSLDGESLVLQPYRDTQTYRNIIATKVAVANFTDDPKLFLRTAFKEKELLSKEMFSKARVVEAPRFVGAESLVEMQVVRINEELERAIIECIPVYVEIVNVTPKLYCRGRFAAIEAVIHATRVNHLLHEGNKEEAENLIQLIYSYRALVSKVSPKSIYISVIDQTLELIGKWKKELNS